MTSSDLDVVDDSAAHRFVLETDGHRAELVYRLDGDRLVLVHTEVPDALGGRGIGGRLVRAGVDSARRRDLSVVPECEFARGWLERHPDVAGDVVVTWPPTGT